MKQKTLSFRDQVFLACFLVTLVPLLLTSVVMVRLFTASLNRQSEQEANRQITEIRSRFAALLDDCEEACRELTRNGTVSRYMIDTTTIEMQRGMYVSLYQASQEIYGHAQISVYDVGGKLRFTTDTLSRADSLPVYWGILKKASGQAGMTWYRTDPYLTLNDDRVLMQGAYAIENSGGARTGYLVLDFTRENFDNVFSGFYSQTDTIWLLDSHKRLLYCSRSDYDETNMNEEEDTQYLWMQEPERGFYVILCRQAPISSPAMQTMGTVVLSMSLLSLVLSMMISGALAGIGAGLYFLSGAAEWNPQVSTELPGIGFNGIPVALLAMSNPLGVIFAAIFVAHISVGGAYLPTKYFQPEIANFIVAVIIYLCAFVSLFKSVIMKALAKKGKEEKN